MDQVTCSNRLSAYTCKLILTFWHLFSPFDSPLVYSASKLPLCWFLLQKWSPFLCTEKFSDLPYANQRTCVNRRTATSFNLGLLYSFLLVSGQWQAIYAASYSSISSPSSDQLSSKYFLVKPSDVYVIEGENAELKCQISSDSDAGPVQWAKDGFLLGYQPIIPGYDRYVMSVNESSRTYNLHIANAQLEDEAEFECQTSGSSSTSGTKQPIRAAANLHLIVSPKSILINSSRSYDNPSHVPIPVRSSLNSSSSDWQAGGSSLLPANSTFQSHSSTFIIEAHESEKIIIVCSVSHSKPPPRLKWYRKNIELLPEAAKTTVSKTLLANRHTLFAVESSLVLYPKSDEEYKCHVEHPGLSKPLRATAQINIYRKPGAPVIEGYRNGDVVNFQEKLTLKCTSTGGYPPPSVIWLRNGLEVDCTYTQTGRHEVVNTLSFVVNQTDNLAHFTCQVANSVTPIPLQQSITLNVLLFPTQVQIIAPSEVLLLEPQGSPVTLQCLAHPASPSPNESKIRWLIDDKEVNLEEANYMHAVKHDQKSWTIRSNLTFVVNSKEPSVRNIACIAFSTSGRAETVSALHQISVIYPPELPTLLGVKKGLATVQAGEIFKCKCVCYSGNPRASLVWLNHQNREISAVTTTTGSGISSELVIRPSASDHGAVFRCHVLHPALEKPYEVSFVLQVLFAPQHLNITFPKFIKENDTIKIECTASPSNPCPTITLLKDGKKMDGDNNAIIEQIADGSSKVWQWDETLLHQDTPVAEELVASAEGEDTAPGASPIGKPRRPGQSVRRQATILKTDCAALHNNGSRGLIALQSVKAVVTLVARAEDDGSQLTCLASSSLIPGRAIRAEKSLVVHYKPKFNKHLAVVEVNEQQNHQLSVAVRANPSVDNLVISRVKETTATANAAKSALNDLIDDLENSSWLLEPIPVLWSSRISADTISLHIHNATVPDAGLYLARVSNTLGDSLFFIRLHVKMVSSINSLRLFSSSVSSLANQTSVPLIREGDKYFRLECRVAANPSITVQWTKQPFYRRRDDLTKPGYFVAEKSSKEWPLIDWSRSNLSQSASAAGPLRSGTPSHTVLSVLQVHDVSYADAGIYSCVTPNDTRQIRVSIEHYPRILPSMNSLKVAADRESTSVKFVCSALAYPISYFNWTVNDNRMVSDASAHSDKYKVISRHGLGSHRSTANSEMNSYHFTSELIIRDVSEETDYRQYQCIAFNQMGADRATFELVQKSFPAPPSNLQAINVTHNSAFLTWDAGFDYGHEQLFHLQLWHLDAALLQRLERAGEKGRELLASQPSRTFANLSVNYYAVTNLEADTYYRLSVVASNRLGQSAKSADLNIHTSSASNYLLKPVYASADEQRLNGLIGNAIIGEDFLELTVILCLILLLVVSLVTSTFFYCRRRRQSGRQSDKTASGSGSCSSEPLQCPDRLLGPCEGGGGGPFSQSDYGADCVQTPTASSSLSNQLTMGLCSERTTTNSLSTTSSYVVKDEFGTSYCRTIGLPGPSNNFDSGSHCKYMPSDKGKLYSDYLTFSSMDMPTRVQNDAAMYPYELTNSCAVNGGKEDDTKNFDNIQLLLSHQQITNVHLLPETLANESICLNRGSSPLTDGHSFISFASMPFEPTMGNHELDKANLCSLPLSSYELTPQYSLDSTASTSPGHLTADSQSYAFGPTATSFSGPKGECGNVGAMSPNGNNLDLYELESSVALSESTQSLPDCASSSSSLKSKAIKRVNLVKASNSSISATLTTLNEEDEV